MAILIEEGRVHFGPDENSGAQGISRLSEFETQIAKSFFESDRRKSAQRLAAILGDKRFPFPKDQQVLQRWIGLVAPANALVLDFFGGSGTTTEAVIRLNENDGGTRRSILVTNNELSAKEASRLKGVGSRRGDPEWEARGVHEYVTRPRLTAVVTGERPDGSTYDDTVAANVEFFDLTYEAPLRVASNREFARIAPLLWMRAGALGRRIDDVAKGWDVADAYGVIADFDHTDAFLAALADHPAARIAFVVTDEDRLFESMCRDLPEEVEPVRLYQAYLRNFELRSGGGAR
jgi:adenine-specific DNA-methyltransferase